MSLSFCVGHINERLLVLLEMRNLIPSSFPELTVVLGSTLTAKLSRRVKVKSRALIGCLKISYSPSFSGQGQTETPSRNLPGHAKFKSISLNARMSDLRSLVGVFPSDNKRERILIS